MDVTIKLVTRGSKANDKLVFTHPCIIRIFNEHNHSFNDAINLGSLKFSEKTKEKLFSYFDKGMSASQAIRFYETQTLHRDGLIGFANTAINPKHRSVCYLHNRWRHYNFGTYVGEDMIAAVTVIVQHAMQIFNGEHRIKTFCIWRNHAIYEKSSYTFKAIFRNCIC